MPPAAKPRRRPVPVTPDTFVIQDTRGEGVSPMAKHVNSLLIRGGEPVLVDTGSADNRERFLEDLFGLVEPGDLRWVFLTHDDPDHHGNVEAVMGACPDAVLITTWLALERLAGVVDLDPDRCRWVHHGETFDAGDRRLVAIRPPLYDSPATRGLLDPTTGVYWAADCFATPVPAGAADVEELDPDLWRAGMAQAQLWNSPWCVDLDRSRYHAAVDALSAAGITTVTGAHTPAITGSRVAEAFDLLRVVPDLAPTPEPAEADVTLERRPGGSRLSGRSSPRPAPGTGRS